MAGPSESRSGNSWGIIYPEFCASKSLRLIKGNGGFTAKGVDNQDEYNFTLNGSQLKAGGRPLLTLERNTARKEGEGFMIRGQSGLLLFSVKKSIKHKTRSDVFLAENKNEECDFYITGKWGDQSCKIYLEKEGSPIIAQMHKDKDNEMTVYPHKKYYPNVDYTFIVALVVVRDMIDP